MNIGRRVRAAWCALGPAWRPLGPDPVAPWAPTHGDLNDQQRQSQNL
jgi:hypothetical protein